jgi:hypothetical protein
MERREMRTTACSEEFLDTVVLGSMLAFASVMPSFDPDTTDDAALRPCRRGAGGQDDLVDLSPDEMPA